MRALSLSDPEIGIAGAGGETPAERTTEREAAVRSSDSLRALGPSWSRCFQGGTLSRAATTIRVAVTVTVTVCGMRATGAPPSRR